MQHNFQGLQVGEKALLLQLRHVRNSPWLCSKVSHHLSHFHMLGKTNGHTEPSNKTKLKISKSEVEFSNPN
jgi:hypothetical protein